MRLISRILTLLVCLSVFSAAQAEDIIIGRSGAYSGYASAVGNEQLAGSKAFLAKTNADGGVAGRRISLLEVDDVNNPDKSLENTRKLVETDKVSALFLYQGTAVALKVLPYATEQGVPFIAPYSGSDALRNGKFPTLFNLRASYTDELRRIVDQFAVLKIESVGVVYQDDAFGKGIVKVVNELLAARTLKPAITVPLKSDAGDADVAAKALAKAPPVALIVASFGDGLVSFVKAYRRTGAVSQMYALSLVGKQQIEALGEDGRGMVVTQIVPSPTTVANGLIRQYLEDMKRFEPQAPVSYLSLEGYIAAQVLVQGLKRVHGPINRQTLKAALESTGKLDLNGMDLRFEPTTRGYSKFVEMTMISTGGRLVR